MTDIAIDQVKLREEILGDGQDDYFGLYEIIWSLNDHYPDIGRDLKIAAARAIIRDLLMEGGISLYRTVWASNHYDSVPSDEALRAIDGPSAWEDPSDDPYFCYAAA